MLKSHSDGKRPRQLTGAIYICATVTFFALLFVAEWVPGLLPYSPNLALSPGPVGSPAFSLTFAAIAVLAAISAILLWRVNRLALVTLISLWLVMTGSATYSCTQLRASCGPRGALSIAAVIFLGVRIIQGLRRNWPKRE